MADSNTNDIDASDLARAMDLELQFLDAISACARQLGAQPLWRSWPKALVEQIRQLEELRQQQDSVRTRLRTSLSTKRLLQSGVAGLETQRLRLQSRIESTRASLQAAMGQLRESHLVASAVLESLQDVSTDRQRYTSEGKLVRGSAASGLRVA